MTTSNDKLLIEASKKGNLEEIKNLIEKGANVNAKDEFRELIFMLVPKRRLDISSS